MKMANRYPIFSFCYLEAKRTLCVLLAGFAFSCPAAETSIDSNKSQTVDESESATWGFIYSVNRTIELYKDWSVQWRKSDREIGDNDEIINMMAEATMVGALNYFEKNPDPALLKECLLLVGRYVPTEFDRVWNATFLELSDVDHAITQKVNEELRADNVAPISDRIEIRLKPTKNQSAKGRKP